MHVSDHVIEGQTILPGGISPPQANMTMSKTKLAAYAPIATTTNVAATKIRLCDERRRVFKEAFAANDRPIVTAAINRKPIIGGPSHCCY